MYGLSIPPIWEFEPHNPIFLVCFKVNMFFLHLDEVRRKSTDLTQTSLRIEKDGRFVTMATTDYLLLD